MIPNCMIDVVACTEDGAEFYFGECTLRGKRFSVADARRLKEKAASVPHGSGDRREYFALFCMEEPEASLERELGVVVIGLNRLLAERQ